MTLAIAQYVTTVLTIDWFGTGVGSRQVKKSLNDQPEGTSLPPIGMPVDLDLNRQRLAVYFRPVPAKLWIDCVEADADEDQSDNGDIRVVGGRWLTDGHPWRLSHDDAVLFVDSDELQLRRPGRRGRRRVARWRRRRRRRATPPVCAERSRHIAPASAMLC